MANTHYENAVFFGLIYNDMRLKRMNTNWWIVFIAVGSDPWISFQGIQNFLKAGFVSGDLI